MKALVQRVAEASVAVEGERIAAIGPGLLILLGVAREDRAEDVDRLARKVRALRVFEDSEGRLSEPLGERELLCVSQFTLLASTRKGNRPSFTDAAPPALAVPLYERFCEATSAKRGRFGARMEVALVNDGPLTLMLET
ncbi:D-tyrosyl-tRNA(Tyr) deacylase [Thermoleophilia bacterium SCSIO 60948]|nr:D-tyrosyl-tRNA(Tyr) deacylase [Thermoleophilia bacterium SCSIO 60948]